jgi:hypothetical protein
MNHHSPQKLPAHKSTFSLSTYMGQLIKYIEAYLTILKTDAFLTIIIVIVNMNSRNATFSLFSNQRLDFIGPTCEFCRSDNKFKREINERWRQGRY